MDRSVVVIVIVTDAVPPTSMIHRTEHGLGRDSSLTLIIIIIILVFFHTGRVSSSTTTTGRLVRCTARSNDVAPLNNMVVTPMKPFQEELKDG